MRRVVSDGDVGPHGSIIFSPPLTTHHVTSCGKSYDIFLWH